MILITHAQEDRLSLVGMNLLRYLYLEHQQMVRFATRISTLDKSDLVRNWRCSEIDNRLPPFGQPAGPGLVDSFDLIVPKADDDHPALRIGESDQRVCKFSRTDPGALAVEPLILSDAEERFPAASDVVRQGLLYRDCRHSSYSKEFRVISNLIRVDDHKPIQLRSHAT